MRNKQCEFDKFLFGIVEIVAFIKSDDVISGFNVFPVDLIVKSCFFIVVRRKKLVFSTLPLFMALGFNERRICLEFPLIQLIELACEQTNGLCDDYANDSYI